MKETYSFHNFMFPFQWKISGLEHEVFSEQIKFNNIKFATGSNWERVCEPTLDEEKDDLYNEKNYFYSFVHDALYDNGNPNSLIQHYERKEPKQNEVKYIINCGSTNYELVCTSINLNLYSSGVGMLSFALHNNRYSDINDVLRINQTGRRLFPAFIGDVELRSQIAYSISIEGLHGSHKAYAEDFSGYTNKTEPNTPADFVTRLIREIATNISIHVVIDDRMFVQSWYINDELSSKFEGTGYSDFLKDANWYRLVFVDGPEELTCQNDEMQSKLIADATYSRWQKYASLYGISRYSMIYLTSSSCPDHLVKTFETIYARLCELILVQKASVLRFSSEVTNISNLEGDKHLSAKVSSLYKEYIRFVNQIHFREISAQDQGIELYKKLYETLEIANHVEKLDNEIEELHNYVSLREDRTTNSTMSILTWIATIAVPFTTVAAFFGMNNYSLTPDNMTSYWYNNIWWQIGIGGILTIVATLYIKGSKKRKL